MLLLSCTSKYLQWVDSVLGVKGVKLIDYRNGIYQYDDTRFYWNRTFDYFLVYPSSFTHGEESDLGNGNHFVNEDSTICLNVYATYFDVFKVILRVVDVFIVKLLIKKLMNVRLL